MHGMIRHIDTACPSDFSFLTKYVVTMTTMSEIIFQNDMVCADFVCIRTVYKSRF